MRFMSRLAKLWLLLALVGSAVYFGYFNRDRMVVSLPPWSESVTLPSSMAYLSFFLMGAIVASIYLGLEYLRKSLENSRLQRRLRELERGGTSRDVDSVVRHQPTIDPAAEGSQVQPLS